MHHTEMLGFELDEVTTWLFVLFPGESGIHGYLGGQRADRGLDC